MNFPQHSFYDPNLDEVSCFYRQGNCVIIDLKNYGSTNALLEEKMTNLDLGDMFMYRNQVLIARSSQQILFFRKMNDKFTGVKIWQQYHSFQSKGLVSGNQTTHTF
jgi:hypothetical protein